MAPLVVKDDIIAGGALAVGQILRLGGFIMAAPLAVAPTMASSINNDAVLGETFLPRQIFVFGGFALRANSLGHLE